MSRLDVLVLAYTCVIMPALASMAGYACNQVRNTGFANHRTLHLPATMWDSAGAEERVWADKLCCVFTWVERDTTATAPYMITYDGGRRSYDDADNFADAALRAYTAICGMYMGSQDCSTESDRCPREYEAVGMLCRPKNNDGYARSTQVISAAACRAKCEADAERCGAFEYEYVSGDDRECELHEKIMVNRDATQATGSCLLETAGSGDVFLDAPVFGKYRCCWILQGSSSSTSSGTSSGTSSSTSSGTSSGTGSSTSSSTTTSSSGKTGTSTSSGTISPDTSIMGEISRSPSTTDGPLTSSTRSSNVDASSCTCRVVCQVSMLIAVLSACLS
eukprot:TRINITY_DN657_c0_g1_i2.p1 TRINITY_DN657_c0_g1~~TRINITY_DN657_c0_g1_i2.p1  ORF type:complete len:334 (+),score=54.93 TRINITY_DN657_c0_g1_i2:114-1115(+)